MVATAAQEFVRIVTAVGGPLEQARATCFLTRVTVVADDPSLRARALIPTRSLEATDIVILGTADQLGITTMTADRRAVHAARVQGVQFQVFLHPPVPLRGS